MPTEFPFGDLQIWTVDGLRLGDFSGVQMIDDTDLNDSGEVWDRMRDDMTITGTMITPHGFEKIIARLAYGWRAKGPIRKRVLRRLVGRKMP